MQSTQAYFLFLLHITFLGSGGAWVIGGVWVLGGAWVVAGCDSKQEAAFSASPSTTATAVTSDDVTVQDPGSIVESFTVKLIDGEESTRPVHMLWALDNSPSMQEEIAGVRAGIKAFAEGLRKHSTVKATVITKTGTSTKLMTKVMYKGNIYAIEAAALQAAGIHVIDFEVASTNQLNILTAYLFRADKLKNNPFSGPQYFHFRERIQSPNFSLHPDDDFLRDSQALKAFVVVTDDGDDGSSHSFISLLQDIYGNLSLFRFFGFLDLKSPRLNDPNGYNKSYHHLLHELGGGKWHIVDISPNEWKQVLDQVQSKIVSEVLQKVFTLKHPVAEILEVKVGETVLESSSYQLKGVKLHITASHLKEGDQLKVTYNAQGS